MTSRRLVLTRSAAIVGAASTGLLLPEIVRAQSSKIRVGLMLAGLARVTTQGFALLDCDLVHAIRFGDRDVLVGF